MAEELQAKVSQLLQEAEQYVQQGERERAHQSTLRATGIAPGEALAWYSRALTAPSPEERLMCLSRAYSLSPALPGAKADLRAAVQLLLEQEPFLAYVHETEEFYQVRSGRDLLVNIPKNRAFETPYLKKSPGLAAPAFRWLAASVLALLLGGVGAVLLAPLTAFQALRLQASSPSHADRVRLWIVLMLSVLIWLVSIPLGALFLVRFLP